MIQVSDAAYHPYRKLCICTGAVPKVMHEFCMVAITHGCMKFPRLGKRSGGLYGTPYRSGDKIVNLCEYCLSQIIAKDHPRVIGIRDTESVEVSQDSVCQKHKNMPVLFAYHFIFYHNE